MRKFSVSKQSGMAPLNALFAIIFIAVLGSVTYSLYVNEMFIGFIGNAALFSLTATLVFIVILSIYEFVTSRRVNLLIMESNRLKERLELLHPGCRVSFLSNGNYFVSDKATGNGVGEYPIPHDLNKEFKQRVS